MTGASVALSLNLAVASLFTVAFVIIASKHRTYPAARWFALAYAFGLLYIATEFLLPLTDDSRLVGFAGLAAFLTTSVLIVVGVASRYGRRTPWLALTAVFIVGLFGDLVSLDMARNSVQRILIYQTPYAVLQFFSAWIVWSTPRKRDGLDNTLMALFLANGLNFLSKPFMAAVLGLGGEAQSYIGSDYALYSQLTGAVLSMATGLLLLVILMRDMVADITETSETDRLSGLLNRRGFEDHVEAALARRSAPAHTLVVCDLDHFKAINDGYGHQAGDRVIEAFAEVLRQASKGQAVLGRTGGEEFAVFLPGANVAAARLFAEGARTAMETTQVNGIPTDRHFTASFGISELGAGEGLTDAMRRADAALYQAKRGGRNRVQVHAIIGDVGGAVSGGAQ